MDEQRRNELKVVLNLFAKDVIKELETAMKKADCNQCAKGYFDSGMILKKRLELFINRLENK